ncbi:hypothetical protein K457DRAFT_140726 [Linnemannia elongata AG-77]|uniref:Uncharacterized protein n=1 Tax=Linnemannia elongata AG-77 TaxID=1314771 RepID=A0A197JMG3_9FUNG|nr:hypothetical protein K457DRAFT_140726 [Linnemannia elongata AG-77]
MPPECTTSNMDNSTAFGDSRSDRATIQGSSGIGCDHTEAGQGGSCTLASSNTNKRPSKKAKKVSPLSRPILPLPRLPGTSTAQPVPEEPLAMTSSTSALETSIIGLPQALQSSTIIATTIVVPPGHLSLPPPQPPRHPLSLQVPVQNNRHQPLPIPSLLHSLDTPPHPLLNLEFIDSRSLEEPMLTLLPPHRAPLFNSRGQEHQPLQTVYPRNVKSVQTVMPMSNESPSSSSFNPYEQIKATASKATLAPQPPSPLTSRHVLMPFNPISVASAIDASSRGYLKQPTYAPPPLLSPHWSVEVVDSYPPVFETHTRAPPPVSLPSPSLHSHPGLLRTSSSSSSSGAATVGGEDFFSTEVPTSNKWIMDQDIIFESRTVPWPTEIFQERVGAREGMIDYQRLQDKQQEYMSTRFTRQVDLGTIQPPLMTLAPEPQPGVFCSSASNGDGSAVGMHLFVETASCAEFAPFDQQSQQPEQQQQQQVTHLQYPSLQTFSVPSTSTTAATST